MARLRVPTHAMQPGDIVGSGETVKQVYDSLACPRGKLVVVLSKAVRDKNGHLLGVKERSAHWGKHTVVGVTRGD